MPVLGYRNYSNCNVVLTHHPETIKAPPLRDGQNAKFEKVEISPSHNSITGRLRFRFKYDYKICLQLHLKLCKQGKNERTEIDMFEQCPIESSGVLSGHRKLDFKLQFPKEQIFPDPFIYSYGSLSYKLVALMSKDNKVTWEPIAKKFLLDFKGRHNLNDLEVHPSVECKHFLDGKITCIFTVNNPIFLVGRDTMLNATLLLKADSAYQVDVTVTLQRKKQIGEIVETDNISRRSQQTKVHVHGITLEWNLDVSPPISTVTYANELTPMYSVRYFMQYEASFKQLTKESGDSKVFCRCDSIVEVKVVTAFVNVTNPTKLTEHLEMLSLESRSSSVVSMPSLPPAYSNLSSRVGSVLSLDTQPPNYDDLNEAESLV